MRFLICLALTFLSFYSKAQTIKTNFATVFVKMHDGTEWEEINASATDVITDIGKESIIVHNIKSDTYLHYDIVETDLTKNGHKAFFVETYDGTVIMFVIEDKYLVTMFETKDKNKVWVQSNISGIKY